MKKCTVHGCNSIAFCRGFCSSHYHRLQRYGSPTGEPVKKAPKNFGECVVDGCHNAQYKKHLCNKHYIMESRKRKPYYVTWANMVCRCTNKNNPEYKNYGGRGIYVCDRWLGPDGYNNFVADMGERPSGKYASGTPAYSLDRIDVDGCYCPENCRWADKTTQSANRRVCRKA